MDHQTPVINTHTFILSVYVRDQFFFFRLNVCRLYPLVVRTKVLSAPWICLTMNVLFTVERNPIHIFTFFFVYFSPILIDNMSFAAVVNSVWYGKYAALITVTHVHDFVAGFFGQMLQCWSYNMSSPAVETVFRIKKHL